MLKQQGRQCQVDARESKRIQYLVLDFEQKEKWYVSGSGLSKEEKGEEVVERLRNIWRCLNKLISQRASINLYLSFHALPEPFDIPQEGWSVSP